MARYRQDIDGLRAIAVLLVVLFHAGLPGVPGGFVGVDVFFVISGYLITVNVHGDLLADRFSIVGFYERRARRILPALFVMMAGVAVGSALFLPDDFKLFAESAAAAALSLSNVFFFRHTGYFDQAATISPLLHTWSLAVEEQFYLAFPPLLWAAARLSRGRKGWLPGAVALAWAASFAFGLWQVAYDPRAAFYLPFDRAWELLTGALLAIGVVPAPLRRWTSEVGAALGLALIVAPALIMASDTPFPGIGALSPCLGAALIIWSGQGTGLQPSTIARTLAAGPVVFVGLISYSLYLWHWPLLVFARYYTLQPPGPLIRAAVVAAAFGLATTSWWFVERPFRHRRILRRRGPLFGAATAATLASGAFAATVVLAHGLPQRLPARAQALAAGAEDHNPYRDRCFALTAADLRAGRACRIGVQDSRAPTLMVWGDSHADALMSAFDDLARSHGVAALDVSHGSCPPLLGVEVHEHEDNLCPPLNAAALALIEHYDIRKVVLAARWAGYAEGALYRPDAPPVVLRTVGAPGLADDHAVFTAGLERTFAILRRKGRQVYVVLPAPEVDRDVPGTLAREVVLGGRVDFAPTRAAYDRRQGFTRAVIHHLAVRYGVTEIDPAGRLCDAARCRLTQGGHPLYYDADHLSLHGAAYLAPLMTPVFADARPDAILLASTAGRSVATRPIVRR